MEEFPPFTVVNGKVGPVLEVQPATYRLRVLKRVERRTYRPVLMRDGRPELDRIPQIRHGPRPSAQRRRAARGRARARLCGARLPGRMEASRTVTSPPRSTSSATPTTTSTTPSTITSAA